VVTVTDGGVSMNNIVRGIDFDLTQPGNPGAAALYMAGAQGAVAQDITVTALPTTFACFAGLNGAGGEHANVVCIGAQYGVWLDSSQPVPVLAGSVFVNQSVTAVAYISGAQETFSMTGVSILQFAGSGPAILASREAATMTDVMVQCVGGNASSATAVLSRSTLYARDLYVQGCGTAVNQIGMPTLPGAPNGQWLHVQEYARGCNSSGNPWRNDDVIYVQGQRTVGGSVVATTTLPPGQGPPAALVSQHSWDDASFPYGGRAGVADARADCGAAGDDHTDDTTALQGCLTNHSAVYLPPGVYRISATLTMPAGASLVGVGNGVSVIAAATTGLPGASDANPVPLLMTSDEDAATAPTIFAFVGLTTWQHLAGVYALEWRSRNPDSLWRVGFESRPCECLWTTAWQQLAPPPIPCQLPVNLTVPKTRLAGVGHVHAWVTDDTGGILSTAASYRHVQIADTAAFASPSARLHLYSLNLEHAQSETNGEIVNASYVDIHSLKVEGNLPIMVVRASCTNVTILGLGGGIAPFAYNFTFPPDFEPAVPSILRLEAGAGVKLAALWDHGYGTSPPYWPPSGGGCHWENHYPYPGAAVATYPFGTWPNATMWNCWFGASPATVYWHQIVWGLRGQPSQQTGTVPTDKPALLVMG